MERWKTIDEYKDSYFVSSWGRVRNKHNKIIRPHITNKGYRVVNLWRKGKLKHFLVSRLVAKAFVSNINSMPQVNHKNGIKTHNYYRNLEWCTNSYNHKHAS
jgi:hypothetical protein